MDENPYRSPESESRREALPAKPDVDSVSHSRDLREAAIAFLTFLLLGAIIIALLSVSVYNA